MKVNYKYIENGFLTNTKHWFRILTAVLPGLMLAPVISQAADGTWTADNGNWTDVGNWLDGVPAGGAGALATFSTTSNSSVRQVAVNSAQTVGSIHMASGGNNAIWQLQGGEITLATSAEGGPVITTSGSDYHFISSVLSGTQGFTKKGSGGLILRANNTYSGVTVLEGDKTFVRTNNSLGAAGAGNGTIILNNAQLHLDATSGNLTAIAEDLTFRRTSGSASNSLYNSNGNNTLTGSITLERAVTNADDNITIGFQVNAGTLNMEGDITGNLASGAAQGTNADANRLQVRVTPSNALGRLNISGVISDGNLGTGNSGLSFYTASDNGGMTRLLAANTYSGSTVHQKGVLLVNNTTGSGTGSGSVSVSSGAIFGGVGHIKPEGNNSVIFGSGSTVAVGDLDDGGSAIADGSSLHFDLSETTGSVTFAGGAVIEFDLNASAIIVAESFLFSGLSDDTVNVIFTDNIVNISVVGGPLSDGLYTLASFDAGNAYSGRWVLGAGLEGYADARLIFNADSIQLAIGTIPEQSTFALLAGLFATGYIIISRRRNKARA